MRNRPEYATWTKDVCCYCLSYADTVDHIPSKVLLDKPYPDNLMDVPCCRDCNNAFSKDEEYVAVLFECVKCQSFNSNDFQRERVKRIVEHCPSLIKRIKMAVTPHLDGSFTLNSEDIRLKNVIYKLCVGHLRYEGLYFNDMKDQYDIVIYEDVVKHKEFLQEFMQPIYSSLLPEVGSRALSDVAMNGGECYAQWHEVQPQVYTYCVALDLSEVRIVVHNYFAIRVRLKDINHNKHRTYESIFI